MSHWPPDYCFQQLKSHRALIETADNRNEADTRLRAIDTILFDVLGWDKLDVDTETYVRDTGYLDYALRVEASVSMIVEAKRQQTAFVLPELTLPEGPSGFGLLAKECRDAEFAMRQAIQYASDLGVRYVAISNGHQWILALTFVANQPIKDRQVIVFESLDAIENKFRRFWECFSPAGLAANKVLNLLLDTKKAPPPRKLSQRIDVYPAPATRNEISEELGVVLGAVWEEVNHDEEEDEFLQQCYVVPEASASALALAKEVIEQKINSDERVYTQSLPTQQVSRLLKGYSPEKPIVVLGNVGNGKSTFLRYLRRIEAVAALDKYIQIDIDFIDRPERQEDVADFIYSRIEDQLRNPPYSLDIMDDGLIRAALNSDLNRFKKTPEARTYALGTPEYNAVQLAFINNIRTNKHEFFKRVFVHLRGTRQFSLAVFFDNLDRRLEPIQEEAFLRASAIARDWASLVFVCLRPTTFVKSSKEGVLDSVAPKLITITPARSEHVLVRRLKYAKKMAEGTSLPPRVNRAPLTSTFSFDMPKVAAVLDCLTESFRRKRRLVTLFEAASNGNTRDMLKYTYLFLTSKFLDTAEIIERFWQDPTSTVPVHHALRALLYGDYIHYDPRRSMFINLFDLQQADKLEHFTRMTVLTFLSTISTAHPTYGFATINDIVSHLILLCLGLERA